MDDAQVLSPITDVARSGLNLEDLGAYKATEVELAAVGLLQFTRQGIDTSAYVIPYYDMYGKRVPFYRVKVLAGRSNVSYLQPPSTPSYVYFPRGFHDLLKRSTDPSADVKPRTVINGFRPSLMIVEGEKKAAKAVKEGFLCCALGGVYNWKTRTIILPEGTKLEKDERSGGVKAKLPHKTELDGEEVLDWEGTGLLAVGMEELIQVVLDRDLQVVITYDTDPIGTKAATNVQKAAAALAYELRNRGISTSSIRQLKLPLLGDKTGVDDFLIDQGHEPLQRLLHDVLAARVAFPAHPNLREYINARLQAARLKRAQTKELAMTIIADLDVNGQRMVEEGTRSPYYFHSDTKVLMPVSLMQHQVPLHETQFGVHLYKKYDIGQADMKVLPWLAAMYTGEAPLDNVSPRAVMALSGDNLAYQISDGQYILVTGDPDNPFQLKDNGTDGLLFKSGQVDTIGVREIQDHLSRQDKMHKEGRWTPWWREVLGQFKFLRPDDLDLMTLIFYASPWLLRWRGTQLPIEIAVGEPGSGKSSLYALRMSILTGRPALRNQPTDVRDWYASITSSEGMYVVDNVHFVSKELKQRLSDEMCRLVTEPKPTVEMRQLYTTADTLRIPVRTVFAMTAIQQPFMNADILQRSVVFEVSAVGNNHDSDWVNRHLNMPGGRAAWVAHHLYAVHMFLRAANERWNTNYHSGHRLANFEQIIMLMGKGIGLKDVDKVKLLAVKHVDDQVSEYDWTMQGLKEFAVEVLPKLQRDPKAHFSCQDIANWAMSKEDFLSNPLLSNSRRLGRYINSHRYMIEKVTGIFDFGTYANRAVYRAKPVK